MANLNDNMLAELKTIIEELPTDAQERIQKNVIEISNNINNIGKHYAFAVLYIVSQYSEADEGNQVIVKQLDSLKGIDKVEFEKYKDELNANIKKQGTEYQYAIIIAATFMKSN